jgi:cell division protein FtsQ
LAKKQARKNYYKNSLARRRQRVIERCLLGLKITLLIGGMTGTSLLLILAYDALTQTSYFEAKSITVEGHKELSKETVLKQAGLKLHENILSVNVSTIRHRLVAHPWVAGAEIERALPDTIHIRVKERTPIAMINLERLFYLDETGVIFKPVESSDKARVPVVTGLPVTDIDFEDPLHSRWFTEVLEVLRLSHIHKDAIPFYVLHRIHVDREMGLTLYASLWAKPLCHTTPRAYFGQQRRHAGAGWIQCSGNKGRFWRVCVKIRPASIYGHLFKKRR